MKMDLTKNIKNYCFNQETYLKSKLKELNKKPILAIIQVGNDKTSTKLIQAKKEYCEKIGIDFEWYYFEEDITSLELKVEIQDLFPYVDGISIQMPLPEHINIENIKTAITPEKDVDGFHPLSWFNNSTAIGIIDYLKEYCKYNFESKDITIFSKNEILNNSLIKALSKLNATISLGNDKTKGKYRFINTADLIISAMGKEKFLNCYSIHAPVFDIGFSVDINNNLISDCINTNGRDVSDINDIELLSNITLVKNVIAAARYRAELELG